MAKKKSKKTIWSSYQKASLMTGADAWSTVKLKKGKSEVPAVRMSDGPCGLRKVDDAVLQEEAVKSTLFPAPCLTACSWDKEMLSLLGKTMALEAIDQNIDVILAPGVNVKRNPLCGRNFEYLSEDPYLSGNLGAAFINGAQGQSVGTCLKHYAANNQEYHRFTYNAEVDERALRELYLAPFEIAIHESDPWMIMAAYNRLNGYYCTSSSFLLKDVLRKEWKYTGVTVSDWGAVNDVIASHAHGLDLEMPGTGEKRAKAINKAYKSGKIKPDTFEESANRLIALAKKAKGRKHVELSSYEYAKSHEVAIKIAADSMVLAKNEEDILPLKNFDDVCVIGGLAKNPLYQGKGSSHVNARNEMSFLDAAPRYLGKSSAIPYAQGYKMKEDEDSNALRFEALDLAGQHEYVLLFLGMGEESWAEGYDRDDMRLPEEQYQLFNQLYQENPNIIVIISTGAPVELPFLDKAKAVVITYMAGEAFGEALSSLLVGESNFSGRLAETWPIRYMDVPSAAFYPGAGDTSLYKESIFVGYRYYVTGEKRVAFPFGHGLSYTAFKYSDVKISRKNLVEGGSVDVSFKIKNIGKRSGKEVIQCYIEPEKSVVMKAKRTLCHFEKVELEKGESQEITFTIPYRAFCHYDVFSESFKAEGGTYFIEICSSSDNILSYAQIELKSTFKGMNQRFMVPNYFKLGKPGFNASDEEFQTLLEMQKSQRPRPKKKKKSGLADWNTPLNDIKQTFIGKKIVHRYENDVLPKGLSQEAKKKEMEQFLAMPIRSLAMGGVKEKTICIIIAMANHQFFRIPLLALFGKRK